MSTKTFVLITPQDIHYVSANSMGHALREGNHRRWEILGALVQSAILPYPRALSVCPVAVHMAQPIALTPAAMPPAP